MGLFRFPVTGMGPPNEPVKLARQLNWAHWANSFALYSSYPPRPGLRPYDP